MPSSITAIRVLLVDDDELLLRAVRRSIRGHLDIHLITMTSAIEALETLHETVPDVIVLDVFMPELDGVEACRRIKASPYTRDIEVVLTSIEMSPELERVGLSAGAARGISKPFDLKNLVVPPKHLPMGADAPGVMTKTTAAVVEAQAARRGADLLVSMLAQAGVDVVFGLPGGAISPVHDALIDQSIRVITTKHEANAMFAAAGYAHATGKLGVVAVTSGPGALNAMTGLASAWCDGLPLLLLVGDVPRAAQGRGVLQDSSAHGLQIVEMSRHITKLAAEISSSSSLPHMVRRAIATAISGRKGPVVLTLPIDVMTQPCAAPRVAGSITMGGHVAGETLDEIAELLLGAERPLILAGSGVRGANAPARLREVAERFSCPVATTPKGKGVFPESHELSLGVLGLGGHKSARQYIDHGVDVVLAIGTSLGDVSTDGFAPALQASRALIHVDIDARQVGKSYSPTHAIVASAAELLGGLADRRRSFKPLKRMPAGTTPPFAGTAADAEGAAAPYVSPMPMPPAAGHPAAGVVRHAIPSSTKPDRIASHDAIRDIQRCLPKDTIYTVDSGEHFLFAVQYLEIDDPDSFVVMTGLGSMGQSIGAALGAKLGNPNRTVAAICGDGCFAMNAFEIATAVQEQIPLRIFVFNDEALGMVENGHEMVYGRRPRYSTGPLDILSIARGLGAKVCRVDQAGQLDPAIFDVPGPVVVEMRIDAAVKIPKVDRVAVMSTKPKAPVQAPPKHVKTQPMLRIVN
ncbi:MAG TPA: thiamine pyrophosphate-binding protein [Kofleriaceae bacterium]|nr:thiamine pyrophosphate-binding protein [Kofleriaceae bacterium]